MVKVYIIDDEETIQFLYKEGLALEGHEIIGTAYNGHQALEEMANLPAYPDVIIIDHRMPIKNGLDTLKEMYFQEVPEKTKILFITADPTVKEEAGKLGVTSFIQKPFSIIKLGKMITEMVK